MQVVIPVSFLKIVTISPNGKITTPKVAVTFLLFRDGGKSAWPVPELAALGQAWCCVIFHID